MTQRRQFSSEIEDEIEREVQRRVIVREQETRERRFQSDMQGHVIVLYGGLILLLWAVANHFWPEITRLAIVMLAVCRA